MAQIQEIPQSESKGTREFLIHLIVIHFEMLHLRLKEKAVTVFNVITGCHQGAASPGCFLCTIQSVEEFPMGTQHCLNAT